jgi:hypothetical protein
VEDIGRIRLVGLDGVESAGIFDETHTSIGQARSSSRPNSGRSMST